MLLNLRTTIFWNILLLMVLAIILISFVVFRITQQELISQRAHAAEQLFRSVETAVLTITGTSNAAVPNPELQTFFRQLSRSGSCREIYIIDKTDTALYHSNPGARGKRLSDLDIKKALSSKALFKKTYLNDDNTPCLTICSTIVLPGHPAAALKMVFTLAEVQQRINKSFKTILLYICLDALVLIIVGMYLMSRYLSRPINKLIRLTESIAEGDSNGIPLFLSDHNEIGKLSTAIKTMSSRLTQEKTTIQEQLHALKEKNQQLQQAHREIIQAEKLASVGSLAAGIAHEIGNPIGIILGYLHMLRDPNLDSQKHTDYLNRMEDSTERANSIIRELLDYARPSSQEKAPLELNSIIHDTFSLVSCQKQFKKITPAFQLADNLPCLNADEKQIRQIFVNLLLNAADAMPDGGTLTITTKLDSSGPDAFIHCTLSDTGCGIPEEYRLKIFDPFFSTKE
ncbi:MAG: HAMP domain-containing protein, partial [Deltaproteobacteria bacterium]|nr:HAMP domain-containing protein [Deltaproteobacteria bacterium]